MDPSTPPAVILVRPQEEGNVGATARAMANMGLGELILVEPAPELGRTGYAFAVGARYILDQATRHPSLESALEPFQRVVGTSSSRQREIGQKVIAPRLLAGELAVDPPGTRTALVFGPEASGLLNDELALCDPLVTVPCAPSQPTLNLAQAVLIVAYELYITTAPDAVDRAPAPAPGEQIERLFERFDELFRAVGFARDDTYASTLRDLRQLAARSRPSEREVQILHGICRRNLHALAASTGSSEPPSDSPSDSPSDPPSGPTSGPTAE
jgi:tRNA/rRNA methyltransferase